MKTEKTVLVVDDCRNHAFFIERAFRLESPSTSVLHLSDGERAVAHLDLCGSGRTAPGLVLLDLAMPPGIDGFTTLELLRSRPHLASLPVLILTGSDDPEHIARAKTSGADGYVVKPAEQQLYRELARQIAGWTPAKSWRTKEIIRFTGEQPLIECSPAPLALLPSAQMTGTLDPLSVGNAPLMLSKETAHVMMSCAEANIDLALLTDGACKEDIVNNKRKVFARCMMALGYANAQIQRYLPFSAAWYEKRRAEVRKSDGLRPKLKN